MKKCFKDEMDALDVFCKEVQKHIGILQKTGVFFSFTTDPMIDETRSLTFSAVGVLCDLGIPVRVLTKSAGWWCRKRELMLLENMARCGDNVQFGWTLTGRDDMEPNASRNLDRIEEMRRVKEIGLKTFASIEPVIDWQVAKDMVICSLEYCDHYMIGLRSGVRKDYYNPDESAYCISQITDMINNQNKTVYLKNSTRKLLRQRLSPSAMGYLLSHTVDMDGIPIPYPPVPYDAVSQHSSS